MKANVGQTDKYFRYALGVLMIAAGFYFKTWWGVIGLIPIITAAISFCPLYALLGINSCKTKTGTTAKV